MRSRRPEDTSLSSSCWWTERKGAAKPSSGGVTWWYRYSPVLPWEILMPPEDRISALLETLSGELSEEKLESLSREFNSLAQDRRDTLVFFVLKNVCQRLASALEGEAVSVERFEELTVGIADQIADILRDLQQGNAGGAKLEPLVTTLFRNLGLFRR